MRYILNLNIMREKLFLVIFLLIANYTLIAQPPTGGGMSTNSSTGILVGLVYDKGLMTPIEYTNIVLYNQTDSTLITGTLSDDKGGFFLSEIPFGTYFLEADFIGYEKVIINDVIISNETKFLQIDTIYLSQSFSTIDEVEVVGTKSYIMYEIDKKIVNVSQNPNAAGGSAADVLENTPSVSVDMEGNVSLRGSSNFKVLIDGKPTVLDANDVLQQTPADLIETIEIITNPSAKYDPEGTSGIINLVLKENIATGLNGIINASYGTWNKYSTDFLFNYRTKKINYFFGADYKDEPRVGEMTSERETYNSDTTEFLYSSGTRGHAMGGYSAKGGFDYYLNDRNTISLSGNLGEFKFDMNNTNNYTNWNEPSTFKNYYLISGISSVRSKYYTGDVTYSLELPKDELTIYGYYAYKNEDNTESNKQSLTDENWNDLGFSVIEHQANNLSVKTEIEAKADYTHTFSETSIFEAGYNGKISLSDFDYVYEDFNAVSNEWILNSTYSNKSDYSNNIQAVYATFSGELAGFGYMAGLRGEYTKRIFTQKTMNQTYPFEKFSFFPSAYITKTFGKENQLQFNYSRRINRPEEWYLNPFPMYSDQYSVMTGNPDLEPEYTNSYELNYQKSFGMSFVSVETFYRKTTNTITRMSELMDDGRLAMVFQNINNETNYGAELMGNLRLFKIMLINPSFSIYQYQVEGEIEDVTKIEKSLNYYAMLSGMFMLGKTTKLQLMGMYVSKSATLQGTQNAHFGMGATLKQELLNKKLTVSLSARNLLNTMKWEFTNTGAGYTEYNLFEPEFPVIKLSVSYKINTYTEKDFKSQEVDMSGGF